MEALRKQVARVLSARPRRRGLPSMCLADPVLARVHGRAPGFGQPCSIHPTRPRSGRSSALVGRVVRESHCGPECRRCMAPTSSCQESAPFVCRHPVDCWRWARCQDCLQTGSRGCRPLPRPLSAVRLDAERLTVNASGRCPSRAPAVAWYRPVLQLVDRDSGLWPCRGASLGEPRLRAAIQQAYEHRSWAQRL